MPSVFALWNEFLESPVEVLDGNATDRYHLGTEQPRVVIERLHDAQLVAVPEQFQRKASVVLVGIKAGMAVADHRCYLVESDQYGGTRQVWNAIVQASHCGVELFR